MHLPTFCSLSGMNSFAFEVTHECKHLLYLYVGGATGVLVWKL